MGQPQHLTYLPHRHSHPRHRPSLLLPTGTVDQVIRMSAGASSKRSSEAVRDHRNAVRDASESLSAMDRNLHNSIVPAHSAKRHQQNDQGSALRISSQWRTISRGSVLNSLKPAALPGIGALPGASPSRDLGGQAAKTAVVRPRSGPTVGLGFSNRTCRHFFKSSKIACVPFAIAFQVGGTRACKFVGDFERITMRRPAT